MCLVRFFNNIRTMAKRCRGRNAAIWPFRFVHGSVRLEVMPKARPMAKARPPKHVCRLVQRPMSPSPTPTVPGNWTPPLSPTLDCHSSSYSPSSATFYEATSIIAEDDVQCSPTSVVADDELVWRLFMSGLGLE